MKILLLISESWNDRAHPNNNMTNWFSGMEDVEIYTVFGGPQKPLNNCCKNYFQITDMQMVKSLLPGRRAGSVIRYDDFPADFVDAETKAERAVYKNRKRLSFPLARLVRSFIWRFGKYDKRALGEFIRDFDPDVIFTQRMATVKMCRMERIVSSFTDAPIVAYTGDDEYSFKRMSPLPSSVIGTLWTRAWLRRMVKKYKLYYMMSRAQMKEYERLFGVKTDFLVKCGEFDEACLHKSIGTPIRLVYAGKLYCNRWKTLGMLADAIRRVNSDGVRVVLDVYTADEVTEKQRKLLHDEINTTVHSAVSADELKRIYSASDVILHVESLGGKNADAVRYSFSTKVMDCLSSGAATMAICREDQAAFAYVKENGIAITASTQEEIFERLGEICERPEIILEYTHRAYEFGKNNHNRKMIQEKIKKDLLRTIEENSKK